MCGIAGLKWKPKSWKHIEVMMGQMHGHADAKWYCSQQTDCTKSSSIYGVRFLFEKENT